MEFIDLQAQYRALKQDIDEGIAEVLNSSKYIIGPQVEKLENELAEYVGRKYCITCSDGTAALQLIYMVYGIGAGDAVFCPDMTFIASVEPACLLGATPVFCDIDSTSYNLDPISLEKQIKSVIDEGKLTPKAIVAVDFVGNPADYSQISHIAKKYDLLLIEDAAQGMGASIRGKKCCSFGDIAATSFFPSKPLGCYGDGGAVFTDNSDVANKIKSLRVHGKGVDKYHNIAVGINSRLDSIQAAILLPKLHALPGEIDMRQDVAKRYAEGLSDKYHVPVIATNSVSSYAQYIIRSKNKGERTRIIDALKNNDIPSLLYYPVPLHMLPVFEGIECYNETYSNTIEYSNEHFGIPFSPYLSEHDQERVIEVLNSI